MRKIIKYFLIIVVVLFHAVLFAGVNFVFPHYETTRVTGVEVKRVDKDGPITKANPADGPTRDVYYIYTQRVDSDKPMIHVGAFRFILNSTPLIYRRWQPIFPKNINW